jgi:DNA-binding NarL/FixJ family response regulator
MTEARLRILLADDQILLLQSLKLAIESLAADMEIVATARNGEEAVLAAESQPIDVALIDVRMPVLDGIAAARAILQKHPDVLVIMLTTFEDETLVAQALSVGVHGYLLKNIAPDKLVAGIRAVRAGSLVLGLDVAGPVVQALEHKSEDPPLPLPRSRTLRLPTWFYELTPREKTLSRLLLRGRSNKEIASEINLGEQTVRNYMSLLYEKLGVSERGAAVRVLQSIDSSWFE